MAPTLLLLLALLDWPAWRGPARDATSPSGGPQSWTAAPKKVWEVKAGKGDSSPVSSVARVYATWRDGNMQPGPFSTPILARVISLDPASGRLLRTAPFPGQWKENIVKPVQHGSRIIFPCVRRGTFALEMYLSSPVLDGGTLYAFSSRTAGLRSLGPDLVALLPDGELPRGRNPCPRAPVCWDWANPLPLDTARDQTEPRPCGSASS